MCEHGGSHAPPYRQIAPARLCCGFLVGFPGEVSDKYTSSRDRKSCPGKILFDKPETEIGSVAVLRWGSFLIKTLLEV